MSLELDKSAWKRVKLGEVVATSKEKVDPSDGSVDRFIAGEHMDTDDLKIHRWGDPSEVDLGPAFHRRFRPGQVLYGSRRTYLRKVAVADFDGVCANTTFVVESKDPGVLLQEFLPFVMTSEPFHAFAITESKGSVNPYVNWSDIARYELDLPPLDEQRRIADLLWAVERHRLAVERQSFELRSTFARWALQQFSGAIGSERRIVDLCQFVIGGVWGVPAGEGEVDVLALGPKSYSDDVVFVEPDGSPTRSITRKQAAGRILREGDIVLERSGGSFEQPVGRVIIAGRDLPDTIPTDFQRLLRPDRDQVEPAYLFWKLRLDWLTGVTRDYARRTTNISNLAVPDYLARTLVVPPKHDQMALVERVGELIGAVDQTDSETEALTALRGTLLAEVFGGN